MPTYQYACTACNHQLEAVQSFTDDPLTQCPQCQGRLRKLFGSVGIVFKGSGFYRTDSRAGADSKIAGNGGKSNGQASGDTGKSGDTSTSSAASNSSGASTGSAASTSSGSTDKGTSKTAASKTASAS